MYRLYLSQSNLDVNSALSFLQERLQQYKLAEMKLLAQQRELQGKIPDIEKCLDIVATLQAKKDSGEELIADFEVSQGIHSRARIQDMKSVCLWLGANVMLEYSLEEATSLLQKNLENPKESLEVLLDDLQFFARSSNNQPDRWHFYLIVEEIECLDISFALVICRNLWIIMLAVICCCCQTRNKRSYSSLINLLVHDTLKSLTGYNCPHLQLGCPTGQDSSVFWYSKRFIKKKKNSPPSTGNSSVDNSYLSPYELKVYSLHTT